MDDEHVRHRGNLGEWREGGARVVLEILVQPRIDHVMGRREHERVAIRRLTHQQFGKDGPAGTRPVVDQHGLPPLLRQFGRKKAREDIGGPAWRKGHDELDRLRREILCMSGGWCSNGRAGHGQRARRAHQRLEGVDTHDVSSIDS
ncbi:hypothetical protein D3C87_1520650 [compost metagenome]